MNSKLADSQKKLEPWGWRFPDPAVAESLHAELWRELPPGHLLFGCVVEVVAFREDQDDVLFRHANHPDRFTVVHLTWIRKQEINDQHPTVCFDGSFAEFLASEQESRRDYIFKPSVRIGPKQHPQILQMAAEVKTLCVAVYLAAIALLMLRLPFGLAEHHRLWIIPVIVLFGALWLADAFFTRIVLSCDNIRVVSVSEFKSFTIPRDQIESITWAKGLGSVLKLRDGKEVRLPKVGRRTNQGLANTIRAWLGKTDAQSLVKIFSSNVSDAELITFVDSWAALLEAEDYKSAFELTEDAATTRWTPEIIRDHIKGYGDASPTQKVTLLGKPTDVTQRKTVSRWKKPNPAGSIGEVWYDLNINGFNSDLTATFSMQVATAGIKICLNDIHVM